ncbi:MAG: carboxypeptidase-like regulatory domain-containing protein [Candidatus Sulfotelmatobacter sp.]
MKQHAFSFAVLALALGLVFGVFCSTPANADNLYASIRGTVVDPSGAVVPDAKLTATNVATGISYSAKSSKDGLFAFLQLPIGDYAVKVEKAGFKTFTEGHIHLDLDQVFNLKVGMEIGVVSDTITVDANPAQVETTSMQLGTTVTGQQIVDIPLNGRNWTQLMQLQPGVQSSSDRFGAGAYSTNGAETQQNSFLINGTDSNDTALNTPLVIPSPDAIGEFNLVSSTINPEYGRNSGAIVNAAIKSGTNQFHGDVFEFYRDTFLDAKSWFESSAAPFHQHYFGGTVGGPIVKDHAFIFFSYEGRRATTPEGYTVPTVYSAAERGGDFSADAVSPGSGTNPIPFAMYGDSASPCPVGGPQCQAGGATPYTYADLFSTGVIPSQDLNPLALKLVNQYVPLPNAAGNTYQFNPVTALKHDQYLGRIDEKLTNKDSIWFYGLYENAPATDTLPFTGATLPGFGSSNPAKYYEYTAAWNHTFSPTTLNEARFAYLRFNFVAVEPQSSINPASYGFNGISPQNSTYDQLPVMGVTGLFTLGFSANGPQPRVQNTYQVVDNFSKVWGHHTFKAGFNMDRLEINNPFFNNLNGNYGFGGAGVFSTGNAGADFLLGVPDSYTQGSGSIVRARGREYYSYAQDQWQVKPSLTLTLGVAWDIETPYKNLFAKGEVMSAFRPGQQSTMFPTAPVGLVFPGDAGINVYGGPTVHYDDIAPRLGFAWSPGSSHNWSIRGGIGLYYNRYEEETTLQTLGNAPFSLASTGSGQFGTSPNFGNPFLSVNPAPVTVGTTTYPQVCPSCGATSLSQPFPFSPPAPGVAPSGGWGQFEPLGYNLNTEDPRMTAPRSTNFNLNFQYQVSKSMIATIGYVGSLGRHELGAYNLNPAGVAPGVNFDPAAQACGSDFFLALCTGGESFQYGALTNIVGQPGVQDTAYSSNYNSLQASLNRRFSNGLGFQIAYTWSRNFDYTSNLENSSFNGPGFNNFDTAQNYGPSANDAPQRLVANYIYTLPFYKFGHHWKRLTDDWNLSGIATFQSGFPVEVYNLYYNDLQWSYPDAYYANPGHGQLTGTPLSVNHNPRNNTIGGLQNYWLNPAAFTFPTTGTTGNANRNPFYGPGLNFWDTALEKDIHFTESKYLQLRLETFDTFNHANFAPPDGYVGDPNFGRVLGVRQITTNGDGRVVQLGGKIYF